MNINRMATHLRVLHPKREAGYHSSMAYLGNAGSIIPLHVEAEGLLAITYHWDGYPRVWNACAPCEYDNVVLACRRMFPFCYRRTRYNPSPCL